LGPDSKRAVPLKDPLEVVYNIQFLIATTRIEYDAAGVFETFSNEYFSASLTGLFQHFSSVFHFIR
jgi:hypothetical protein